MFNFGSPETTGGWLVHVAGAIFAIFLIYWMRLDRKDLAPFQWIAARMLRFTGSLQQ